MLKNHEGYPDPTPSAAFDAIEREERAQAVADIRAARLVKTIRETVDLAGFDLIARVELRDRRTGRTYT